MTRKKSNVKALALAVTCAILAGGYSALNPVYAAEAVNYDDTTKKITAGTEIKELIIAGVHIGSATSAAEDGRIEAKNIKVGEQLVASKIVSDAAGGTTGGIININGAEFVNDGAHGAITASSLSLDTIGDVTTAINSKAAQTDVTTNSNNIQKLNNRTTNISYDALTNTTIVNGIKFHTDASSDISDINDGIIKFSKNGAKDIVQINSDLMFNDDATGQAATLTLEGVKTLNGLSNGSSGIKAGNGSEVGGVTFDNKNITNINNATVDNILKVKTIQSIDGNNEITVEEMATTKSNTAKISYDPTDGTTIAGDVMVNKDAPNQVKINNEGIVVGLHSTVVGSDGFYAGGHDFAGAQAAIDGIDGKIKGAGGKFGVDDQGNVTTTGDIKGKDVTVDGKLSANGDAVVGGDLSVSGKANFTKEATFAGGITTDAINEATLDKGVTVDGVLLKDKGISAAGGAFTVDGTNGNVKTTGDIEGQNITANGALKGASLDVTNDAAVGGKLDVTGDTTLKGKLDVTGDATFGGDLTVAKKITGQSLNIGATGNEFTVDTVGNVKANGITTSDSTTNKIGGVTLAGSDINAKNLTLTGTLAAAKYNATDIEATNSIKVGATTMTNGKLDLGSNGTVDFGANELNDAQVGNINNVIQSGGIVKAADGSVIGGVSFSAKDIPALKI